MTKAKWNPLCDVCGRPLILSVDEESIFSSHQDCARAQAVADRLRGEVGWSLQYWDDQNEEDDD